MNTIAFILIGAIYYFLLNEQYKKPDSQLKEWAQENPAGYGIGLMIAVPSIIASIAGLIF